MNTAFFKGVLVFALWSRVKECPKVNKDLIKECERLFDKVNHYQSFVAVPDKQDILESVKQALSSSEFGLCADDGLKDSKVLDYLEATLQGTSPDDLREFLKITLIFLLHDHQISMAEKENLYLFAGRFNMPKDDIDHSIEDTKKSNDFKKAFVTHERIKTRQERIVSLALVIVGIFMILLTGYGISKYLLLKSDAPTDFVLGKYVEQNPYLVFRKVSFSKYIAYGTRPDANPHLMKLYVYHVKGSADFQFNLKNLEIDKKKTDYISKRLSLVYRFTGSSQLPIEINVNISEKDIYKIEEVDPQPISESEARAIAKVAAVPAGIMGAYVGGKIGGMFKMQVVGNVVSGFIGAGAGGAAASAEAYVMTKRFFTGLKLAGNSVGEQEQVLASAKPIIAVELIGGSLWDNDRWEENIHRYYENELNDRLREIFSGFGWKSVEIEY